MSHYKVKLETLRDLITELQCRGSTEPDWQLLLAKAHEELSSAIDDLSLRQESETNYDDLEARVEERTAYLSRLNQLLEDQIYNLKRMQVIEQEQRTIIEVLQDSSTSVIDILDLNRVLDRILDHVRHIVPYDGANVLFVESDTIQIVRQRGYVERGIQIDWLSQHIPVAKLTALQHIIDTKQPLAIPDTATSPMWVEIPGLDWIRSNVIAPICLRNSVMGFLCLDSATPGCFTQTHAERLESFAEKAAIAIQNARLYDRAKKLAVKEERNRLANELHDTISQTLWSINLIAERLPSILEVDIKEGERSVAILHQLGQNAIVEMRSLLLELRPSAITAAKISDLIRQLAEIVANRTGLIFSVVIEEQVSLTPEVQVVLYRVVQEAINNVVRHALAHHVDIYLNSQPQHLELAIQDDGQGFDPAQVTSSHLGLSIMRDRVREIGMTLEIDSQPQKGTLIRVTG